MKSPYNPYGKLKHKTLDPRRLNRNDDAIGIRTAIHAMLKSNNMLDIYNKKAILSRWEELMGTTIANRTQNKYIHKGILFLSINSAALKNEMLMSKAQIITMLNREAGEILIHDIIFK